MGVVKASLCNRVHSDNIRIECPFAHDVKGETTYNGRTVAGRAVHRGRKVLGGHLELGQSNYTSYD